jgi:hypothetical protein
MRTFLFNAGIATLFTHELDAMLRSEWHLLFILGDLPSEEASWWFIYLHLPMFLAALYLGNARLEVVRRTFRLLCCGFLPIHALLHYSLSDNPLYQFHHILSELLIYTAGILGAIYVLDEARDRFSQPGT